MKEESNKSKKELQLELDGYHRLTAELKSEAIQFAVTKRLQKALFRIVDIAISTKDLSTFYQELHLIVSGLTSAKNFFITLYHPESDSLSFPYYEDDEDDQQGDDDPLNNPNILMPLSKMRGSPTENVITNGKVLHIDHENFSKMSSIGRLAEDWIGIPLIQDGVTLGALVVQSYEAGFRYSQQDEELLVYVSQHIATAIRRKQDSEALKLAHQQLQNANFLLEQRVANRTKELELINSRLENEVLERSNSEKIQSALYKITDLVSTATGLNDLFAGVHQTISELMYADNTFIALVSEDGNTLEFPYFVDINDDRPNPFPLNNIEIESSPSLTMQILRDGEPLLINPSSDFDHEILGPKPISWLAVPLKENSTTFGILVIQSYDQQHIHTKKNLTVLMSIAKQISNAILRRKDSDALIQAHEYLERRVKERTSVLEKTIINRRKIEKQLEHESLHDALTQLPNRRYLSEQLKLVLESVPTNNSCDIALLFLDLDRFKIINDSLGHHVGDLFLVEVSKRLMSCMRNDDVVVRLGGDEFCILMVQIDSERVAVRLAERVLNQLRKPVEVLQHSLITSASIGIRVAKIGIDGAVQVIGDADSAMYQAKHNGKNRFCLFDANVKKIISQRLQLEQDLRKAIGTKQISLYFQPILDLLDLSIVGTEALLRWEHPTNGFISPIDFIPIAEETGLIQELGESVVKMACQALNEFAKTKETAHLYVNFNISPVQILSRTLDGYIRKQIAQYNIDPTKLNAEITESILIEDFKAATQFVQELKSIGMKVYLDDFGTGYSSLSYLHQFPFDLIKLDRSFIQSTSENNSNNALIESIGFLATNLGMDVVVEGIETESQMYRAKNLNLRYAQGFLFSKPLPKSQLIPFVKAFLGSTLLA